MSENDENEMTFKTAGNRYPLLTVGTGVHTCGQIRNGVSLLEHGSEGDNRGSWVLAFSDLEAWYLAAKAHRAVLRT
jgi:hypothetical protein